MSTADGVLDWVADRESRHVLQGPTARFNRARRDRRSPAQRTRSGRLGLNPFDSDSRNEDAPFGRSVILRANKGPLRAGRLRPNDALPCVVTVHSRGGDGFADIAALYPQGNGNMSINVWTGAANNRSNYVGAAWPPTAGIRWANAKSAPAQAKATTSTPIECSQINLRQTWNSGVPADSRKLAACSS